DIERRNGSVVAQRPRRGIIERLFGFGDEEEDEATAANPGGDERRVVAAATPPVRAAEAPKRQQIAAAIPLPPIRPPRPSRPAQPPAQFELAAARPSPADIVRTRGDWTADTPEPATRVAAAPAAQPTTRSLSAGNNQRFEWLTGPAGQ